MSLPDSNRYRWPLFLAGGLWASGVVIGLSVLWNYQHTPGKNGEAPRRWPSSSSIQPSFTTLTLVMIVHPQCPCSRSSIDELARLMTQGRERVKAYVLFYKPRAFGVEWVETDLWKSVAEIPGVQARIDFDGTEALRFGASTSGQTLVYSPQGELLFEGGLTAFRGHSGDSDGRDAIVSLLKTGRAPRNNTPVFGCGLKK